MDVESERLTAKPRPRSGPRQAETEGVIAFGPFLLDGKRRILTAHGQPVALQSRSFDLLELLLACRGEILTKDEIIGHVWRGIAVGDNNLGVQLSALRRVLAEHGGEGLIVTVPGRGYRLVVDVVSEDAVSERAARDLPHASESPPATRYRFGRKPVGLALGLAMFVLVMGLATLARWGPDTVLPGAFNPPPHSVGVLAFANLTGDATQDYLSDGLSEAVIDILSRIDGLQVTARTSSFYFKGKAETIDRIARRLNVGAVLEGSVRRQANRLRIDAHLSDSRTGYQLWSQSYERDLADMLTLQDEIADAVSDTLQARLLNRERAGHDPGGTSNPLAFTAYLRARQHMQAMGDENDAALAELRTATELDPNFGWALTDLSSRLLFTAVYTISTANPLFRQTMAEARQDAERAAAADPGAGLPHAQLGLILVSNLNDFAGAWDEAVRARALTPGNAAVEEAVSTIARLVGHRGEAMVAANRAVALDPLHWEAWDALWRIHACNRDFVAAQNTLQHIIDLQGHPPSWAPFQLGMLLLRQDKPDEARRICETSMAWTDMCLAMAYHALGRQKDAEAQAAKLWTDAGNDNSYNLAVVHAQWHESATALRWLAKAREINDPGLQDLACESLFDPLRDQPGFRAIAQSLHLPPPE